QRPRRNTRDARPAVSRDQVVEADGIELFERVAPGAFVDRHHRDDSRDPKHDAERAQERPQFVAPQRFRRDAKERVQAVMTVQKAQHQVLATTTNRPQSPQSTQRSRGYSFRRHRVAGRARSVPVGAPAAVPPVAVRPGSVSITRSPSLMPRTISTSVSLDSPTSTGRVSTPKGRTTCTTGWPCSSKMALSGSSTTPDRVLVTRSARADISGSNSGAVDSSSTIT